MSFRLATILINNNWKPINCVFDGNLLDNPWYIQTLGNETIDLYMVILDYSANNHILISCQNKENNEVIDFWFEMIDIMPVEDIGDMQFRIMYPGNPVVIGEPSICLAGSFNRGSVQNEIAILGFGNEN